MYIEFEKWHGAKNDFVLTWLAGNDPVIFDSLKRQATAICNRNGSGIGADGILVLHTDHSKQALPKQLSIINSDGSLAATCGNGIRCAALSTLRRYRELEPKEALEGFELPLKSSTVSCRFLGHGDLKSKNYWPLVSATMGIPKLNAENETLYHQAQEEVTRVARSLKLPDLERDWALVNIANNHLVFFLDDADRQLLQRVGPAFQESKYWDGINVHLAVAKEVSAKEKNQAANKLGHTIEDMYHVFVWERGAGETQACGSGACAVTRAALESGLIDRSQWLGIRMPGGLLFTQQLQNDEAVNLAGPATLVFTGSLEI